MGLIYLLLAIGSMAALFDKKDDDEKDEDDGDL